MRLITVFIIATWAPTILAGATGWVFFWALNPRNSVQTPDVPPGEPQTNAEFEKMLTGDAINGKVLVSKTDILEDDGATYWWGAFLDLDVVEQKYVDLAVIGATNLAGRPEKACNIDFLGFPAKEDGDTASPPAVRRDYHPGAEDADSRSGSNSEASFIALVDEKPTRKLISRGRYQKRAITSQKDAPRQLKFISLPENGVLADLDKAEYRFDDTAGFGTRVYVVDSGLNLDSSEWASDDGREVEFLFAGDFNKKEKRDVAQSGGDIGHGTCMADLAVGKVNGVAKRADLTVVQIDEGLKTGCAFLTRITFELELDGVVRAAEDMVSKDLVKQGALAKSVLSMSIGVKEAGDEERDQAFALAYSEILNVLSSAGVTLVASFPNDPDGDAKAPPQWPSRFANPDDQHPVPGLIAVGSAVLNDGTFGTKKGESWITVYAPGDDRSGGDNGEPGMTCAKATGDGNSENQRGTSHATAMVAGLMAYYKGLGFDNDQAREQLLKNTVKRASGDNTGPSIVWNGAA